ncbi:MAG TPA: sigma-54 dependent transcriptional regulator [Moheibacter sp.]|nr:sigma-54 dependent transcriptional regulator [Moheibacter sp.]
MDNLQTIKQRFGIIGNDAALNHALEKAMQVAPTDISVLVSGESGVGKEFIPKIIHSQSARKHNNYVIVNCGAIPEGTIDSELFGHEKGAFTGATTTRKGYFEVADRGTIFLDEVGELPLPTQVRLLRVLESGEFMKVGSSEVQKTDVRIVAATNVKMESAVNSGKFREDLYYRLNTVQIDMPALRNRKQDIPLLFRKFAADFATKYRMPALEISTEALQYLMQYPWPGNIRQLRNFAEEISVVEKDRMLDLDKIKNYLPYQNSVPMLVNSEQSGGNADHLEREILFKFLLEMKKDLNDLRTLTLDLIHNKENISSSNMDVLQKMVREQNQTEEDFLPLQISTKEENNNSIIQEYDIYDHEYEEVKEQNESLSLQDNEKEMIIKALDKHKGKRRAAADELGISERTLYRKIKQYNLE